jgi:transcriptional regulator with XRE-family HTH domain
MHIGNRIKEEVAKKNMSVTDFAKLINKSRPYTYSIFEKDNIDTGLLIQIANVLDMSPSVFFEDIIPDVMQGGSKNISIGRDNNGHVTTSEHKNKIEDPSLEIKHLKEMIAEKDKLIEEKERLINVLLKK